MASSQSSYVKVVLNRVKARVMTLRENSKLEECSRGVVLRRIPEDGTKRASPLYGFVNHPIEVKCSITLSVTLGDDKHTTIEYVQFYVVDHPMAYNAIFRKTIMRMKKMVVVTPYMKITFSTRTGVGFL
ncbi:hypothetical protein PVK06_023833 [Gossypium arboreum]|uniref:Uncharacterized protein n=1 Tax=Gossypium arboreum TaxID=29729 RepID=A0ABR0PCB2_GOSAR|nr:hypothetical protein PVK06_023833 [Gossypium arboreum]